MESLEKMKSKVLDEIKQFGSGKDKSEIYDTPQVIDGNETVDEIEVIDYHLEVSKDPAGQKSPRQMMKILNDIKSMEHWTKMQVMVPIFDKIYQLIKSKYAYEKVFHHDFERAHYSAFTVNYADVFNEAHDEAIEVIWEPAYKKAVDPVFDSPIHDSV